MQSYNSWVQMHIGAELPVVKIKAKIYIRMCFFLWINPRSIKLCFHLKITFFVIKVGGGGGWGIH